MTIREHSKLCPVLILFLTGWLLVIAYLNMKTGNFRQIGIIKATKLIWRKRISIMMSRVGRL